MNPITVAPFAVLFGLIMAVAVKFGSDYLSLARTAPYPHRPRYRRAGCIILILIPILGYFLLQVLRSI
jgi:hypothetical protein